MKYELTVIAPEDISSAGIHEIKRVLMKHALDIGKFENDGVKTLAYPITSGGKRHDRGRYLFWDLWLPDGEPSKLSCELNINDLVVRYLLVKADTRYGGR